jgi:hypothetical protein
VLGALASFASAQHAAPVFPQQINAKERTVFYASNSPTEKGHVRRRYCEGFISGVEEGLLVCRLNHPSQTSELVRVPTGTSSQQMSEVFIRYASRKDVALEKPAAAAAIEALIDAFACWPQNLV